MYNVWYSDILRSWVVGLGDTPVAWGLETEVAANIFATLYRETLLEAHKQGAVLDGHETL